MTAIGQGCGHCGKLPPLQAPIEVVVAAEDDVGCYFGSLESGPRATEVRRTSELADTIRQGGERKEFTVNPVVPAPTSSTKGFEPKSPARS
jgi:hypothetical protein